MKRLTILLTALLTAALCAAPALAANRVETLTTDVALRADGSAHVTQVFSADTAEGTEFYVDRMDSGCLTYSRFAVSDENGSYAVLPDGQWDIDASFDEKAGKCGLLEIDGGVELCWGITEYGRHDYTVSYDIGGLAGAYSDADGFNYRFIDPDQSIFPTSASADSVCGCRLRLSATGRYTYIENHIGESIHIPYLCLCHREYAMLCPFAA